MPKLLGGIIPLSCLILSAAGEPSVLVARTVGNAPLNFLLKSMQKQCWCVGPLWRMKITWIF